MKGRNFAWLYLAPALVLLLGLFAGNHVGAQTSSNNSYSNNSSASNNTTSNNSTSNNTPVNNPPPPYGNATFGVQHLGGTDFLADRGTAQYVIGRAARQTGDATVACLWVNGTPHDLGTLGGGSSTGHDVNSLGEVVGVSQTVAGDLRAFLIQPLDTNSDLVPDTWYVAGTGGANALMQNLGTLGGTESRALGINELGDVIGESTTLNDAQSHGFYWTNGVMQNIGTLGGAFSIVTDINNNSQVVGRSETSLGTIHAFRWAPVGGMVDLGTLGGSYSSAVAINDTGYIVGNSETLNGQTHAFLKRTGALEDLGTLGGEESTATGINSNHLIVGYSETVDGKEHAFVARAGVMNDLGTLGGARSRAMGVTDANRIIGFSYEYQGVNSRATWWNPQ